MEHIHVAVVGKAIYLQQKNPLKIFERLFLKHLKSKIHCCLDTRKLWRMHPLQKHPEAIAEARSGEGSSWILRTIIYRPKRSDPIIAVRCCDMQHRSSSGNYSVTFSFPCLHLWFPTQHKQLPSVSCIDGEELRRTVKRFVLCYDINKIEVMVVEYWQRRPITNSRKEVETCNTWAGTSTTNWTRKIRAAEVI